MDRLFLDANVLFSAAYRDDAGVARLWALAGLALLTSDYAIEEARRNLDRADQIDRLDTSLRTVDRVPAVTLPEELRGEVELPEKDWPILGGAIAARATNLITGDKRDFGRYFGTRVLGVFILPPADYLLLKGYRAP